MPREIRVVSDLPRTVQDQLAVESESRAARADLSATAADARVRLSAIVSGGAQYTPDQVRDALVDVAAAVDRITRVLQAG